MSEVVGIQETKELLVAVNELSIELIKHLKDGVQVADAVAILDTLKNNADFKAKLEAGYTNVQAVPAEIKDLSLVEGGELVMTQISYLPKILEAAKKA